MKIVLRKFKSLLGLTLLLLFVGYVASSTLFYHTHIVNGVRIVHSHPFSQTPDSGTHKHSTLEFETIALLSLFMFLAVAGGYQILLFGSRIPKSHNLLYAYCHKQIVAVPSLRAPPVCASLYS